MKFVKLILLVLVLAAVPFANSQARLANEPGTNESAINESATKSKNSKASVTSTSRDKILEISSRIDELVKAQLDSNNQDLNKPVTDEIFLRRAYLDIIGRIPTIKETKKFLGSKDSKKREELIDELLDSYGYVSHQYNFFADLLRVKTRMSGQLTGNPYIDYLKDSLVNNKPYNEFVHDLVASDGPNLVRDNGAVGYYLRDRNMPEDNMSNTVRIFLGTRLECAQCHDHPFDKWTQRQYFEMVAFTGGMQYRAKPPEGGANYQQIRQLIRKSDIPEKQKQQVNRISQAMTYGITGSGTGLARLPEGFLGADGEEGDIVTAKEMFDGKPLVDAKVPPKPKKARKPRKKKVQQAAIPGAKPINSRNVYAQWLTDSDNPRFATVIANRLWKKSLGLGLIEPVDIIEDNTEASNPELMEYLAKTMIALDFDMKQFQRAIFNTKTYQAMAYQSDITDPAKFNFNGPVVRRMSAEQIWDSMLVLTVPNTDVRVRNYDNRYKSIADDPYEAYEKISKMNLEEIKDVVAKMSKKPSKKSYKDRPEYKQFQAERAAVNKKIQKAKKQKNTKLVRQLMIEQAKITTRYRQKTNGQFVRASELASPAPAGHFVREFGQSDREQIENSNTDPAVTQVLSMMNGMVEERIARDSASVLMQTALAAKSGKECTESIFLSMLNRQPTKKESRIWEREFKEASRDKNPQGKNKEVYTDLIWTLANSNEFIFVK
ncbi:MAG: DUF1549 domain-containing protein [Mariniblastus sp.]